MTKQKLRDAAILTIALGLGGLGLGGAAQAAVTVTTLGAGVLTPLSGSFIDFNAQPASNNGVALGNVTLGGIHFSGDALVFTGTKPGVSAQPFTDNTRYISVLGGKSETLTMTGDRQHFGLYWGSLDTYNTIKFYDGASLVASFNGSQIATLGGLTANGGQNSFASSRYVNFDFTSGDRFDRVVLKSGNNSFELDNIYVSSPIPEPATWAMMLIGFAGLGYVASRRRARAA